MGINKIEAKEERFCDRCRKVLTGPTKNHSTWTKTVETTVHYRWAVLTRDRDDHPSIMQSRFDFCDECEEAWGLFLQGRATPPTERGAQVDERARLFAARQEMRERMGESYGNG